MIRSSDKITGIQGNYYVIHLGYRLPQLIHINPLSRVNPDSGVNNEVLLPWVSQFLEGEYVLTDKNGKTKTLTPKVLLRNQGVYPQDGTITAVYDSRFSGILFIPAGTIDGNYSEDSFHKVRARLNIKMNTLGIIYDIEVIKKSIDVLNKGVIFNTASTDTENKDEYFFDGPYSPGGINHCDIENLYIKNATEQDISNNNIPFYKGSIPKECPNKTIGKAFANMNNHHHLGNDRMSVTNGNHGNLGTGGCGKRDVWGRSVYLRPYKTSFKIDKNQVYTHGFNSAHVDINKNSSGTTDSLNSKFLLKVIDGARLALKYYKNIYDIDKYIDPFYRVDFDNPDNNTTGHYYNWIKKVTITLPVIFIPMINKWGIELPHSFIYLDANKVRITDRNGKEITITQTPNKDGFYWLNTNIDSNILYIDNSYMKGKEYTIEYYPDSTNIMYTALHHLGFLNTGTIIRTVHDPDNNSNKNVINKHLTKEGIEFNIINYPKLKRYLNNNKLNIGSSFIKCTKTKTIINKTQKMTWAMQWIDTSHEHSHTYSGSFIYDWGTARACKGSGPRLFGAWGSLISQYYQTLKVEYQPEHWATSSGSKWGGEIAPNHNTLGTYIINNDTHVNDYSIETNIEEEIICYNHATSLFAFVLRGIPVDDTLKIKTTEENAKYKTYYLVKDRMFTDYLEIAKVNDKINMIDNPHFRNVLFVNKNEFTVGTKYIISYKAKGLVSYQYKNVFETGHLIQSINTQSSKYLIRYQDRRSINTNFYPELIEFKKFSRDSLYFRITNNTNNDFKQFGFDKTNGIYRGNSVIKVLYKRYINISHKHKVSTLPITYAETGRQWGVYGACKAGSKSLHTSYSAKETIYEHYTNTDSKVLLKRYNKHKGYFDLPHIRATSYVFCQ